MLDTAGFGRGPRKRGRDHHGVFAVLYVHLRFLSIVIRNAAAREQNQEFKSRRFPAIHLARSF